MEKIKRINRYTLISLLIAISPFGLYIYCYPKWPEKVAIHFTNGVADRYVNKSSYEILLLCGLGLIMVFIMKVIELISVKMAHQIDENLEKNINILTLIAVSLFTAISIYSLIIMTGINKFSIIEIVNIILGILFIIIGNYMPKFTQNNFFGFRTNQTLTDKNVWFKTQRFSGKVWIAGGIIMIIVSLILGHTALVSSSYFVLFFLMLMVIIPYIYSKRISHMSK